MYTLIFMPSRGDSVRQYIISQGHLLFFFIIIFALFFAAIGGLGYGFFQRHHRISSEESLQTNMVQIEELVRTKLQTKLELAAINEERNSIRHMANQIQRTLGILGQGGGNLTWTLAETED